MQRFQQHRHALGSQAILTLVADTSFAAEERFAELWQQVAEFEARFSRFQPDSELTAFNHAAGREIALSPEFIALLRRSQELSAETEGLYNPLILPGLNKAGYKGSWPHPLAYAKDLNYEDRRIVPASEIMIRKDSATLPKGTALDFGGIGKGYLLDQLADWLDEQEIHDYWLSLGGDIVCNGHDVIGKPWQIGVQKADEEGELADTVSNDGSSLAIATSGTTKRRGEVKGKPWHHLIDPRTGEPADTDILTATVTARGGADADVFAKCVVIVGSAAAQDFIATHNIEQAILQYRADDGTVKMERTGR